MNSYSSTHSIAPFMSGVTWQGVAVQLKFETCVDATMNALQIDVEDKLTG